MRFGSGGPSDFYSVQKDDPQKMKCIDPEGLGRRRTGTSQRPCNVKQENLKSTLQRAHERP